MFRPLRECLGLVPGDPRYAPKYTHPADFEFAHHARD